MGLLVKILNAYMLHSSAHLPRCPLTISQLECRCKLAMNPKEELIMIHETLWLIPTYISINRGLNSSGKISFGGCDT